METAWLSWGGVKDQPEYLKQDYLEQFEHLLKDVCAEEAPDVFYWPSSPSSGGGFDDPNSLDRGDVHDWSVWHGRRPFSDFTERYPRFCSEFGFESFPRMDTLKTFVHEGPMDDFIETGSGGGIGFGLCDDITHPVIDEEKILSRRKYHTITESKNGAGAVPIRTDRGWIHIAHGVRNTAAGLRYVLYAFATDLKDPSRIIAEPGGLLLGPLGRERTGDVSNVVFTNGAIADDDGKVYMGCTTRS